MLKSYILVRLLDQELLPFKEFTTEIIENSIRKAEIAFLNVDFHNLEQRLKKAGWSLEYIYLDPKKNRYSVDKIETP